MIAPLCPPAVSSRPGARSGPDTTRRVRSRSTTTVRDHGDTGVREDLVARVRGELARGVYHDRRVLDERIDACLDKLLADVARAR